MNSTISTLLSLAALLIIAVQMSSALSITEGPQGGSAWALEDNEEPVDYRSVLKLMKYEILLKLMNDLCDELDMCPPSQVPARQAPVVRRGDNNQERRRGGAHLFWRTGVLNKSPIMKAAN
ncbi:uncharacterized protein LOC752890 [Strongylocentrotus purpuratus]|uniref:Uncharacterized protein n=1 Tax=Strongylocentrotus purpuratus TaxID=7668 RepID=A0A7M7G0Q2_STRPU|nr:uncharacterized protein LOC752890 [Strongylocentrotus purpuratus]|eukprot:XP_001177757.1 PREDICTED: uncharacterized protein LOC752890 [Strongylocentrotus purpuratus]